MAVDRMAHLMTVSTEFHARVLVARLGTEGVVAQLRGSVGGPYPMGDVRIFVPEDELDAAREILVLDEAAAVVDDVTDGRPYRRVRVPTWMWALLVVMLLTALEATIRV